MTFPTHIVAAAGYVVRGGDILLVKTFSRGWVAPGGQIENGESLMNGVLREVLEESGITAVVRGLISVWSNVSQYLYADGITPVTTKVMFDFVCDYVSGEPTPSDETEEVLWVPQSEALSYITSPPQRYQYQKFLAFSGKICYASYATKPEFQILSEQYL